MYFLLIFINVSPNEYEQFQNSKTGSDFNESSTLFAKSETLPTAFISLVSQELFPINIPAESYPRYSNLSNQWIKIFEHHFFYQDIQIFNTLFFPKNINLTNFYVSFSSFQEHFYTKILEFLGKIGIIILLTKILKNMEKFNEQKTKILRNLGLMLMFLGILITSSGELEAVSNVVYPTIGTMIVGLTTMCIGSIMFHKNEKSLKNLKIKLIRRSSLLLFSNLKFI